MFDYTTIMIARKEHEELSCKGTPEYSLSAAHVGPLRTARNRIGNVLISLGERLRAGEPTVDAATAEA